MTVKRSVVVLAAGQGTRMKSPLPKVLHPIAGAPMAVWAVQTALDAGADEVVAVVGHGREKVEAVLTARFGERVKFAVQAEQKGTADAVKCGLSAVSRDATEVLVTYGDAPCVPAEALRALIEARRTKGALCALVTAEVTDPTGYGRILRDKQGGVVAIREHKDCTPDERAIRSINAGLYAVDRAFLEEALGAIRTENSQGEFYLTDLVSLAAARGPVAEVVWEPDVLQGVNDRAELARLEDRMYVAIADRHRRNGVTVATGARIDHDVQIAADATIGTQVSLRGTTVIGTGVRIDVGCVVDASRIGAGSLLKPYTVVTDSSVGENTQLGPFAHLRPKSDVEDDAHVGNFVELKNTRLQRGAKANHLAYLGDGDVGPKANIGAGTIFCNYDGEKKHRTTIGAGAFVGSNSSLVAPVTLGEDSYVGSGSVITQDVPAGALAIGRTRQVNKEGYVERLKALRRRR